MAVDVPLRCACGVLRGALLAIAPGRGIRVVCYCDDCQSFASFLGRVGAILDARGGTEIFQTSSARVAFTRGRDRLACMRLRPDGMVRWYAACCRTPIGNTLATRRVPFVGVIHACLDLDPRASATEVLGPIRAGLYRRYARGDRVGLAGYDRTHLAQNLRALRMILAARLRGDHARSPFFLASGALAVTPRVLDPDELRAVEAARDAVPSSERTPAERGGVGHGKGADAR